MISSATNKYLYVVKSILGGLLAAQLIATVHVYLSNMALYQSMQMVQTTGYLAVPNEHVWSYLQQLETAFWGGLFFTLSIGTGLSLAALVCAWSWDRLLGRKKAVLALYLLVWAIGILAVNANGFSGPATAYLVCIPLPVFLAALRWMPSRQEQAPLLHRTAYLGIPVLLIIVFLPLVKKSIYLEIRDTVLLSNAMGRKITTFYYDYTLFAAQAFKSLEQKTLRTARLTLAANASHRPAIEEIFLAHDYLVVTGAGPVDLNVVEKGDNIVFQQRGHPFLSMTLREFAADPAGFLQEFSIRTDRCGPLRLLAFMTMVIGAPLCLYIILHGMFLLLLAVFAEPRRASLYASIICLFTGLAIAAPLYRLQLFKVDAATVSEVLQSERWQERVAALRFLAENEQPDSLDLLDSADLLASPHIPERYWYVRALGNSRSPAAGRLLLAALDDPGINVVTMAFFGLGRRGNRSVVAALHKRVTQSAHWYEQWYGYRALRALGWRQEKK